MWELSEFTVFVGRHFIHGIAASVHSTTKRLLESTQRLSSLLQGSGFCLLVGMVVGRSSPALISTRSLGLPCLIVSDCVCVLGIIRNQPRRLPAQG